ncbi:MAG: YrbL family protein [Gammaproteobacteria bacterium]|nr:YrbL family protein [Gammaproteobacteria bacterium]
MADLIHLSASTPFARGGNRLVYVHPERPDACIKLPRGDVDLAAKRRRKGLKGRMKPAATFDDNRAEARTLTELHRRIGGSLASFVPRFLGWVDTDLGRGVCVDLVRDDDGAIATPLKQYVWESGFDGPLEAALGEFTAYWVRERVPSRELLLHNVVARRKGDGAVRLVVIDGLGNADLLPLSRWSRVLARRKSARKAARLRSRIEDLVRTRAAGGDPGEHGFLRPPG